MQALLLGLLGLLIALLLLVGPVLALVALLSSRRQARALEDLERRLLALEGGSAPQPSAAGVAGAGSSPPPAAAPAPVERAGPGAAPPRRLDLETLIAGRWLNRLGVVVVLLAAAFFLRFAFENEWIGALGRVVIGLLCGTALLVSSQWLLSRGLRYFSEGIAGLGAGVLFLSLYAAWAFYELIPELGALAGMVAVTGALATLALARDSQRLAALALSGGLATPGLLESSNDSFTVLFSYLAVLVVLFLALAWSRIWRWLAPPAFVGVALYWLWWQIEHYRPSELDSVLTLTTLLFSAFAIFFVARARSADDSGLRFPEVLLALANSAAYGIALHRLLAAEHRWALTAAVLGLGALHVAAARAVPLGEESRKLGSRFVLAGLALSFATAAIPIRLQGESIPIAFAIEGAVLVWAGFRAKIVALRLTGSGLLGVVLVLLFLSFDEPIAPSLLNARFLAFGVAFAAFVACLAWARPHLGEIGQERLVYGMLAIGASLVAVWGLSEELWRLMARQTWELNLRFARQMGLSVLWTVAAGGLIGIGVRQRSKLWRWQGLALLAIVIVKVFAVDLSFLDRAYRIASLLVLGIVLLAVSFAYQRAFGGSGSARAEGEDEGEGSGP